MASTAVEAEFAVVYVIGLMTVGTAAAQPVLRGKGAPVTAVARHLQMRALQGKVRLPIVIELPLQPVHRVVAQGAVLREAVRMGITVAVALDAFHGGVAEYV